MTTATNNNNNNSGWFIWLVFIGIVIWLITITTSCGVLKNHYLQKYCKESDSVATHDVTTIEFDTLKIPYPVQGETVYLQSPCDSLGKLKPINITKTKNGITSSIKSIGNTLVFDCKEDSLMYIIETQKRVIETFEKDTKIVQEDCKLEHLSKTDSFWIITGRWLLGLLIAFILLKVFKTYLSNIPVIGWLVKFL